MYRNRNILLLLLAAALSPSLVLSACQPSQTPTNPSDTAPSETNSPWETDPADDNWTDPTVDDWTDPPVDDDWTDPPVDDDWTDPPVDDDWTDPPVDDDWTDPPLDDDWTDPPENDDWTDPPQEPDSPAELASEVRTNDMVFSLQQNNTYKLMSWSGNGDSVTIPATAGYGKVTAVADACFKNRTGLKSVVISNGVTRLGDEVFFGCTSLRNVTIPSSVAAIGHSAFHGTPWYTAKIAESNKWLIVGDGVLLKYSGTGVTEVTVPSSVKYISDAFYGNTKLTRINVRGTCRVIGQYAFADCPKLHTIGLPVKLDYIASNSVAGCPVLQVIKNLDENPEDPQPFKPTDSEPVVQSKPEGVTPASIKVMSWNVWHENVWTGQCTNWDRLSRVIDVVKHFSPDVFMTQETTDWWVIYLMQNLPAQYTWAYTQSNGHDTAMPELHQNNKKPDETHSAIFYNQEKLELLDNGIFWPSETPNVMSKYYESWCFRIVTWAKFRDKATGREFICTNVHLDGETDEPFNVLMDFVNRNIGTPTILAGDFNRKTGSAIMNSLNAYAPLKDASQAAPVPLTESKNNLDWVFVSRNTVEVQSYIHGLVDGIKNPSDHKPRVVELLIY